MGLFGRSEKSVTSGSFDVLVVGLGNPGKQYARSRHNVGEEVVVELARRHSGELRPGRDSAMVDDVRIGDKRVVLAFPLTFMNESGQAVRKVMRRFGFKDASTLIVVQDELDLPPGAVKIKKDGGLGGHNGLKSISAHVGTHDYIRVRIGIGKPGNKEQGANHVLSKVPAAERQDLDRAVQVAADAVEAILAHGLSPAMNSFNAK
jgi:PTH1 family peptidyl-tRNA hydrolase